MRGRGPGAEGFEILGSSEIAKGLVGSVVVEAMGEGVDERLELVDAVWHDLGYNAMRASFAVDGESRSEIWRARAMDTRLAAILGGRWCSSRRIFGREVRSLGWLA